MTDTDTRLLFTLLFVFRMVMMVVILKKKKDNVNDLERNGQKKTRNTIRNINWRRKNPKKVAVNHHLRFVRFFFTNNLVPCWVF